MYLRFTTLSEITQGIFVILCFDQNCATLISVNVLLLTTLKEVKSTISLYYIVFTLPLQETN